MKIVQMCVKERTKDQFPLRSIPTKILQTIENLERKEVMTYEVKTYAEALQSVGTSNCGGEVLEPLKAPNVLKKENHNFNRIVGIYLEGVHARLTEDELLGLDTLSFPPRLCTDTSSQNSSRYRTVS